MQFKHPDYTPWSKSLFLSAASLGLVSNLSVLHARDLHGRFGLGFNSEFAQTNHALRVPALSVKYAFTRDFAVEGVLGVATSSASSSVIGGKLFKNLFVETAINFYAMAGAASITLMGTTGAQFIAGVGAEFFIPRIESLGFAVETGASFDNATGPYVLRTMGFSFLEAGIHFYF